VVLFVSHVDSSIINRVRVWVSPVLVFSGVTVSGNVLDFVVVFDAGLVSF